MKQSLIAEVTGMIICPNGQKLSNQNGLTYLYDLQLWVAGGKDNPYENVDSPSEHTSESVDFNGGYQVQQLQWDFSKHCVTKFNTTYNIIIGGVKFPQKTLLVHSKTLEMIPGEVLTGNGRHSLACAHIRHNNGSNYVIAAGGMSEGTFTDTSEILDVENTLNGWHPGINSCLFLIPRNIQCWKKMFLFFAIKIYIFCRSPSSQTLSKWVNGHFTLGQ